MEQFEATVRSIERLGVRYVWTLRQSVNMRLTTQEAPPHDSTADSTRPLSPFVFAALSFSLVASTFAAITQRSPLLVLRQVANLQLPDALVSSSLSLTVSVLAIFGAFAAWLSASFALRASALILIAPTLMEAGSVLFEGSLAAACLFSAAFTLPALLLPSAAPTDESNSARQEDAKAGTQRKSWWTRLVAEAGSPSELGWRTGCSVCAVAVSAWCPDAVVGTGIMVLAAMETAVQALRQTTARNVARATYGGTAVALFTAGASICFYLAGREPHAPQRWEPTFIAGLFFLWVVVRTDTRKSYALAAGWRSPAP